MRKTIWVLALLIALAVPAPAMAGAGLPQLARLEVGSYQAQLLGDSPQLHTGTNTITVSVPGLFSDNSVSLEFVGPKGQIVQVPLRTLVVLDGPDAGHDAAHDESPTTNSPTVESPTPDSHSHSHEAAPAVVVDPSHADHHGSQDSHGEAASTAGHGHDDHDESAYQIRGKAVLPESGPWTAVLSIDGAAEEFRFNVVPGGPNRLFVGATGSVMGAALVFGVVGRRRQQNKEV